MNKKPIAIFWHRRDLRIHDNAGLYHALKSGLPVLSLFIFDTNILDKLEDKTDKRVSFIHRELTELNTQLSQLGTSLLVKAGTPMTILNLMPKSVMPPSSNCLQLRVLRSTPTKTMLFLKKMKY